MMGPLWAESRRSDPVVSRTLLFQNNTYVPNQIKIVCSHRLLTRMMGPLWAGSHRSDPGVSRTLLFQSNTYVPDNVLKYTCVLSSLFDLIDFFCSGLGQAVVPGGLGTRKNPSGVARIIPLLVSRV